MLLAFFDHHLHNVSFINEADFEGNHQNLQRFSAIGGGKTYTNEINKSNAIIKSLRKIHHVYSKV